MLRRTATICLLFVFLGCGAKDGRPPMARVSGTVTYKGKPVAGAAISFVPATPGVRSALGKTDDSGAYTLSTYDPNDGAPVGKCGVAIELRAPPEKLRADLGGAAAEELQSRGKPLIPARYLEVGTSGLSAEVTAGGSNKFDFELQDAPAGKPGK